MTVRSAAAVQAQDAAAGRLSVALGRLVRVLRRDGGAELGPGSISALVTLSRHGAMRLGDLASREGVAPPTLSRIVAGLEDGGYVSRQGDPQDRRAVLVACTAAGERLVCGVRNARSAALRGRLAELPPDQWELLLAALPALEALAGDEPLPPEGPSPAVL